MEEEKLKLGCKYVLKQGVQTDSGKELLTTDVLVYSEKGYEQMYTGKRYLVFSLYRNLIFVEKVFLNLDQVALLRPEAR